MNRPVLYSILLTTIFCCTFSAFAQQQTATSVIVPRLIRFGGVVKDSSGKPLGGVAGVTFALYQNQDGGGALWLETQNVTIDETGHYSVLLGATKEEGVPMDLFVSGQAQWLGVQMQGESEQPRVLLVSVPYALKAADAETLGGLPPSAFAPAAKITSTTSSINIMPSISPVSAGVTTASVSGSGTANFVPLWASSSSLTSSTASQVGGNLGLGFTAPLPASFAARLDVNGGAFVRGPLTLPATGAATSTTGNNSHAAIQTATAFSSVSHASVSQSFRWQAEPLSNNTVSPSATLNLLFSQGTGLPTETGLKIGRTGKISFAPGQSFPGTGSVTSVGSGAGLTGGPITHSGTLSIPNGGVTNAMLQNSLLTVKAGTDLIGGGAVALGGTTTLNLDTTKVPQLASTNHFMANQAVTGNISATGSISAATLSGNGAAVTNVNSSFLNGLPANSFALVTATNTFPANQIFNGNAKQMIVGDPGCGAGFAGLGFGALSGCKNYSLRGDGKNTYINRPIGGTLFLQEGNSNQMSIVPGGSVSITQLGSATGAPALKASAGETTDGMQAFGGGGGSEFANGGRGLLAEGGTETNTSTLGGDGVDAFAGEADQGGNGVVAQGGTSRVVGGGDGIDATAGTGPTGNGLAGNFFGDAQVSGNFGVGGNLTVVGTKMFKIDHPLDPANKYLNHASVESSEMMNIYTGNVTLDASGSASIQFPEWFEAVNTDFRYQLTAIGAAAPNLHVAEELANRRFRIAGGAPGLKVSWQITGVRHDAFAQANPLAVEVDKPMNERGFYLNPRLYGQPEEKQIEWGRAPVKMRHLKELRAHLVKRTEPKRK